MASQSVEEAVAIEAPPEEKPRSTPAKGKTTGKPKHQPRYHVIIWNDETHTYEYVIDLLMRLFGHSLEKAFEITSTVDRTGKGIAFTTHKELAELKRDQILAAGADWRMEHSTGPIRATIEAAP